VINTPADDSSPYSQPATPPSGLQDPLFARRLDSFQNKTVEAQMRELTDRELIRDLVATYAHRVAHALSNADLFTDDGVYLHRRSPNETPEEVRGRAALDAHFITRPGGAGVALPMIHNHLIDLSGDEAAAVCSIELRLDARGESVVASGYYQDRLRRENGRWKFVVRDVTFFHWVPIQVGWATPRSFTP
jgi:hypothetical protein